MAENTAESSGKPSGSPGNYKPLADQVELALNTLRQARLQIAQQILTLSHDQFLAEWRGTLSSPHGQLLQSPVRYEPPDSSEEALAEELRLLAGEGLRHPQGLQRLAAAMLYHLPASLEHPFDIPKLPSEFLDPYMRYMLAAPQFFASLGDAERHTDHLQRFVGYLHTNVLANPRDATWKSAAMYFLKLANLIPVYFSTGNLRELYRQRAQIIEHVLLSQGHQLEHRFADRPRERKHIRVGVYNSGLSAHSETYVALPVFEHLPRDRFEVFLYTRQSNNNQIENHCRSIADHFCVLPTALDEQARRIRQDDLDILLITTNVTAVTNDAMLLASYRLARIQTPYGGSPVTTGLRYNDVFLSQERAEPDTGSQAHYTETVRLLSGNMCFHFPATLPPPSIRGQRDKLGIGAQAIVFASSANFLKLTPELREVWARILKDVPGSVLALCPFGPFWSSTYPANIFVRSFKREFASQGLDPDRLIVLGLSGTSNVREFLKTADVYLDSFPYGGSTSLLDPFAVGIPIIALEGSNLRTRLGSALLHFVGLSQFVTTSVDDYVKQAIEMGNDAIRRQAAREAIVEHQKDLRKLADSAEHGVQFARVCEELVSTWKPNAVHSPCGAETQGARHNTTAPPSMKHGLVAAARMGPNQPCPCGSGKKYKKCCLNRAG